MYTRLSSGSTYGTPCVDTPWCTQDGPSKLLMAMTTCTKYLFLLVNNMLEKYASWRIEPEAFLLLLSLHFDFVNANICRLVQI
jgi:hypothetical protein